MALEYDKIVMFGDSITEFAYNQDVGFVVGPALQNLYSRKLDVIQRGYGGYTSDHATVLVDKIIQLEHTATSKIKLLIVFFGTNDSVIPGRPQHVPLDRYKSNLRKIASAAAAAGIKVMFVGVGPINEHHWLVGKDERRGQRTTLRSKAYCDAAIEVGKELNVPVVPLWYAIMHDAGWKEGDPYYGLEEVAADHPLVPYFSDGLHFAGPAYKVEYNEILKAIKEFYPELQADSIPMRLPPWADIVDLEYLAKVIE